MAWKDSREDFDSLGRDSRIILLYIAISSYVLNYSSSQNFRNINILISVFPFKSALDAMHFITGNSGGEGVLFLHF